jgi:hypothetical protein
VTLFSLTFLVAPFLFPLFQSVEEHRVQPLNLLSKLTSCHFLSGSIPFTLVSLLILYHLSMFDLLQEWSSDGYLHGQLFLQFLFESYFLSKAFSQTGPVWGLVLVGRG